MQDNSTNDIIEILTRYMDGELSAEEKNNIEKLLKNDIALQERYQHLFAAKQAIKMQGLKQRVQVIQNEYLQETQPGKAAKRSTAKKISVFRTFMSAAAILIIVIAGYALYQYSSTTNESVYSSNFISYTAPVSRGNTRENNIAELYNAGKYTQATQYFESLSNKSYQDYFIAAQTYLNLDNSKAAIDNFRRLENLNSNSAEKYYVQETDYYLMLAYIKNGNISEAEKLLNKITSDKQHLFYKKAKNISAIKLTILKWKNED